MYKLIYHLFPLYSIFQLKGCPLSQVEFEVHRMIGVLRLAEKRDVASKKLSGGQRRKLSVGIALIAGSKVCRRFQYQNLIVCVFIVII